MKPFLNQNRQTRRLIYLVKEKKAERAEKDKNLHGRRVQLTFFY